MKKLLSVLLIAAMLLCIAGCAGKAPGGRYDIVSMESSGIIMQKEQLKSLGVEMFIIFNSDGTGILGFGSGDETETDDFTWEDGVITGDDGDTMEYSFDGTSVTLSHNNATIIFQ